ncbi:MAG: hypothetical protein CTR54_05320 [Rhizobium sp.]|nr:MAG: hypothetical protein CTR54_05320 [Rhizobium sp.]
MIRHIKILLLSNIPIVTMFLTGYRGLFFPTYVSFHYALFFYFRFLNLKSIQRITGPNDEDLVRDHKTEPKWALTVCFPLVVCSQIFSQTIKESQDQSYLYYVPILPFAVFLGGSFLEGTRRIRI